MRGHVLQIKDKPRPQTLIHEPKTLIPKPGTESAASTALRIRSALLEAAATCRAHTHTHPKTYAYIYIYIYIYIYNIYIITIRRRIVQGLSVWNTAL